jgi:protein-S-isoprenylcysteine O-methyltransferase Ste14
MKYAPVRIASIGGIISVAWLVFALYWLWAARDVKQTRRNQPARERLVHVLWMAAAFYLLYRSDPRFGLLNNRFVPDSKWIAGLGAALTVTGVAFAIWARRHLGKYWSAEITIRHEHQLIRTGPYSRIRHPIYTGLLLAIFGTALAVGEYRALLALALFGIGWARKAKTEELFLEQEFGSAFDEHKRRTGFFLPRLVR